MYESSSPSGSVLNRERWLELATSGLFQHCPHAFDDRARTEIVRDLFHRLSDQETDGGAILACHAHLWGCVLPLLWFASPDLRGEFLKGLANGEIIAAHAATEPETGSDLSQITTVAIPDGNEYVLTGRKNFVTNGALADVFLIYAAVPANHPLSSLTAFLVERDRKGLSISAPMEKMGLDSVSLCSLELDECRIPMEHRLGRPGSGFMMFQTSMLWERTFVCVGLAARMERILRIVREFASQRKIGTQALDRVPAVRSRLVDMYLRLETAKLHTRHALDCLPTPKAHLAVAATKALVSEAHVDNCREAVAVMGGRGYLRTYGIERELRDAMGGLLYSGTSDVQREIVASLM